MNGKDRQWFEERFGKIDERLGEHGKQLACLETKWKMAEKFLAVLSATTALLTTVIVRLFWR